jgi:AbrB family looped-hinge helix DNA binding protein
MQVTVDRVGRIVIPKPLRDALGIGPDTVLDVTTDGGGIRLELPRKGGRTILIRDGLPVAVAVEGVRLTDAEVRRIRDDISR